LTLASTITNQPDLAPIYKGGHDFINNDDDDDDDLMDDKGHGTHIAGIIAATRNCKGTVGIASDAEIYAIKASDSRGRGLFSGLVKVINWAIGNDSRRYSSICFFTTN
jgi:subtilisin family serine protease